MELNLWFIGDLIIALCISYLVIAGYWDWKKQNAEKKLSKTRQ